MGQTKYNLNALSEKENDLIEVNKRIDYIFNRFKIIKNSVDTDIIRRDNISNQFNSLVSDFQNLIENTYNSSRIINRAITEYSDGEQQIHNLLNGLLGINNNSCETEMNKIKHKEVSMSGGSILQNWFEKLYDQFISKVTHIKKFFEDNGVCVNNKDYSKTVVEDRDALKSGVLGDLEINTYSKLESERIFRKAFEKESNNPKNYGNGFITISGKKIPIFIPSVYSNGSNANFNNEGWNNNLTKTITDLELDWINAIGHFGDTLEEDTGIPYKEVGRKQIMDYGNFNGGGKVQGALLALEIVNTAINNATKNVLSITVQEKDGQQRAIIQFGSYNNTLMKKAGITYDKLAFGYWAEPGHNTAVKGLNDYLTSRGYGEYVEGERHTNVRLTVDSSHANDPYVGYIGVNDKGQLTMTAKLYKDDNAQIVSEKTILYQYYYGEYDVKYDMYNDLRESGTGVIKNSKILKDANKQYIFSN
ncbi:hypothetical protein [Vallitalea guaymasensis]|uniref:Uncharacterized protein n=1 Tax=Vallitalea guaymasensis TaxID=1185412 RepID=A0A8J8M9B2_9FIRM|nr:hypothetical protein [Vallitalea guaymasensis]QUH28722.1 hypothetical protein HYG85_07270 [Vallitalea guaymasensis]